MVTQSWKAPQTRSAKHLLNLDEEPFARAYFTHPFFFLPEEKAHVQKPAHTQKNTEPWSFQLNGFVSAVRLNMGTCSIEHTLVSQWVSIHVCFWFFFFIQGYVLSSGLSIFHTKADTYSYLLRAKQIDMTVHVSFIWCRRSTESLHPHTHTYSKRR